MTPAWLEVRQGDAPLVVGFPHTGTDIAAELEARFVSPWLARKDADWWVDRLYDFAAGMGATTVRTAMSRSVIDVNRDPSGASLYPGQATTALCPTTSFDGEPLYRQGQEPSAQEIETRRAAVFEPYHAALRAELARLKDRHGRVVLYDAHSIRSRVPRLFDGELPQLNIGANGQTACAPALAAVVEAVCAASPFSHVLDGRFKGGWTTRRHGRPDQGVHAIQMELACRGYMREPLAPTPETWPTPYEPERARSLQAVLHDVLAACLSFAAQS